MPEMRDDLEQLAIDLANAKHAEDEAKAARIKAEEALADAIGGKEVGSTSAKCGRLSVTVKRGFNYKINEPRKFASQFPDFVKVTEKIELIARNYEDARTFNSDTFSMMSPFITATPKKVAVEIKL